ncbi:Enoyl-CoA hydratase/isomerase [Psychromonas ingrahamii 37]|uniref:Enoyl-CoA hydratase/isomerase n=1 Tax=Psychromonas ingrahamii (strain DSM 17664 / CCUG 51855 / 37) TaxID=357804 RepID=A1SU75_PSYIN|nr:enoyl-CoA hydratase/isomerase family protein [Psychromonas ingrahamii]ABM03040.1 Enoyl-CoA hydratase/isomerase [Psychromonas ingrahamii 37]
MQEISYQADNKVGHIRFPIHNGAMDLSHCRQLLQTIEFAKEDDACKVIILWGGPDFFSNGIDLNAVHLQYNASILTYKNLKALNKIVHAVLTADTKLVISALQGSASAGGVMLAIAADLRYARQNIVLNPSYANLGLCGSEYWSVLLPAIIGVGFTQKLLYEASPISATDALRLGLIHQLIGGEPDAFQDNITAKAEYLASTNINARLAAKSVLNHHLLAQMETQVKLELEKMKDCCNHPEFELARAHFVEKNGHPQPLFLNAAAGNIRQNHQRDNKQPDDQDDNK